MPSEVEIGSYVLDTLQIYFAWDDDLYTYLKERGFGQSGFQRKTLPLTIVKALVVFRQGRENM